LALTCGEPAGIGPDICLLAAAALAQRDAPFEVHCLADESLLGARARLLGLPFPLAGSAFRIVHRPLPAPVEPGRLDPRNSSWVLHLLDRALAGCRAGEFDAMVTAPVQKSVINEAGIPFTGHTEYLAAACGVNRPVMLLAAGT
jgi:4-hydroxythreonine-4-phosphate dehydrogenase